MGCECGSVSAFVAIVAVALLVAAGLVLDGGRLLTARRQAADIAGNAARIGAQQLDEVRLRDGQAVVDPVAGADAVARYLATTPATGTARISGATVVVDVQVPVRMLLLDVVGTTTQTVTATRRARAARGVATPGAR